MSNSASILILDDDPRIRELLRSSLEAEGFTVFEARTSKELYKQLDECTIDLITMDITLDQENGLDLVRDIRRNSEIPIILVTGRVDLIDTVLGLELGADDYITKPFLIRELVARVRSILRRTRASNSQAFSKSNDVHPINPSRRTLSFGEWGLTPCTRELRNAENQLISLTSSEFDLLEIFLNSPQRVLTRDHLMETLTGRSWHPSDRVIDNHVVQLRKKLESDDGNEWIKTVRGAGYLFAGKVTKTRDLSESQ